jgi:hypothetical protein
VTDRRYSLKFRPAAVRQQRKLPKDAQRRLRVANRREVYRGI